MGFLVKVLEMGEDAGVVIEVAVSGMFKDGAVSSKPWCCILCG